MRNVDILYIEDDSMDVDLAKTVLNAISPTEQYNMSVVDDGEKALQYLEKREPYHKAVRPDIILLDLNLPRLHGTEVLKKIRESEKLKNIPVVILTTSSLQADIDRSYELGACAYLTKPNVFKDFKETFRSIWSFWIERVKFADKTFTQP